MRRRQKLVLRKQQSEPAVQPVEQIVVRAEYAPGQCPLCGHEIAPPSLPGIGAEAGQGEASTPSPDPQPGITYLHDDHTRVTLPKWDWDPSKVVLRDMNDFPQQLDAAIERNRPKRGKRR